MSAVVPARISRAMWKTRSATCTPCSSPHASWAICPLGPAHPIAPNWQVASPLPTIRQPLRMKGSQDAKMVVSPPPERRPAMAMMPTGRLANAKSW